MKLNLNRLFGGASRRPRRVRAGESGFTLLEAIVATAILITGLTAVANLTVVSIGSNAMGNRATTAAFLASQKMEELRATNFDNLVDSPTDSLDVNQTNFHVTETVDGVGTFDTRWLVRTVTQYGASLKYLTVRTEAQGAFGRQSRAEFTTYRSCTTSGCTP